MHYVGRFVASLQENSPNTSEGEQQATLAADDTSETVEASWLAFAAKFAPLDNALHLPRCLAQKCVKPWFLLESSWVLLVVWFASQQ